MTERLPFVVRPITYDIPEKDQKGYSRREEREIGGVKYYFYYMDDDKAFTDYMGILSKVGKVEDSEITQSLRPRLKLSRDLGDFASFRDFFKCKCQICTSPDQFETFYTAKDYKVVEGVRKVECKGILGGRGMSFFQHPCDALEGLLPVFGGSGLATVTDAKTGVTQSLDAALEQVRHKGESYPSPYLTHVYTVNPDE